MSTRKRLTVLLAGCAAVASLSVGPAVADGTTVSVDTTSVGATAISVGGTIDFGSDATGNVTLGEDGSGDALVPGLGLDLASISVRTDLLAKKLIWTLTVNDGIPAPAAGNALATGYNVPIMADDDDRWRFLAAGSVGSHTSTAKWTDLCHQEASDGVRGPTTCSAIAGSITDTAVTWTQSFSQMKPKITFGSTIRSSASVYEGMPCSVLWPWHVMVFAPAVDCIESMDNYKVPGEVLLGIAPAGDPESFVDYLSTGTFNATTGSFSGSVSRPPVSGAYTVWVKSCYGAKENLACAIGGRDVTT